MRRPILQMSQAEAYVANGRCQSSLRHSNVVDCAQVMVPSWPPPARCGWLHPTRHGHSVSRREMSASDRIRAVHKTRDLIPRISRRATLAATLLVLASSTDQKLRADARAKNS